MFGMSFGEILIIAIIAILFIGPDKLPETMVKIAKFFRSFKQTVHETKESIEQEIHLSELKEEAISYKKQLDDAVSEYKISSDINIVDDLKESIKEVEDSVKNIGTEENIKPKAKKSKKKKVKEEDKGDENV